MKSIIIAVITFFAFLFLTWSCSSDNHYKVAYLMPSKDYPRFNKEGKFIIERLKQLGIEAYTAEANNDDARQIEEGIKLLDQGIDLLIVTAVNGNTIAPLVREAQSKGVPVIAYNRLISNAEYDMFFTGDNIDNGKIFCDYALKMKPRGNYVILNGDRFDRNGVELKHAIDSILKPSVNKGDIHIVYESYVEGWDKDNAKAEMDEVLHSFGTNIDVVIAASDPMGVGVIEALKEFDLQGKVLVTGQDAELQSVINIHNGLQHITIYHPHRVLGYKAAELAKEILEGKNPEKLANAKTFNGLMEIPTLQVKSVPVTKESIEKELIQTGEYKWDQILQ